MPNKGILNKDIITAGKFRLLIAGVQVPLTLGISNREEAITVADLPDGTKFSTGRTESGEFTVSIPQHEEFEYGLFESWWNMCKEPVSPSAYKTVIVQQLSQSDSLIRTATCFNCFLSERNAPELDIEDGDEEMTVLEYTISFDDIDNT